MAVFVSCEAQSHRIEFKDVVETSTYGMFPNQHQLMTSPAIPSFLLPTSDSLDCDTVHPNFSSRASYFPLKSLLYTRRSGKFITVVWTRSTTEMTCRRLQPTEKRKGQREVPSDNEQKKRGNFFTLGKLLTEFDLGSAMAKVGCAQLLFLSLCQFLHFITVSPPTTP